MALNLDNKAFTGYRKRYNMENNDKDYIYFYSNGAMVRQALPKYGSILVTVVDGQVISADTTTKIKYSR